MEEDNVKVLCSELTPIAEPKVAQFFNKRMYVWDDGNRHPVVRLVVAILPNCDAGHRVITSYGEGWCYCCEIGESEVKPRFATRRELARWLAQGNGQRTATNYSDVHSDMWVYPKNCDNEPVDKDVLVRKWDDEEWHEPTIDYLGIKEG